MQWGEIQLKNGVFTPTSHDKESFLVPSLPLGTPQSPAPLHKTLLLPYNYYNFFFNKTTFINNYIFEITTKFIPSNQNKF